MKITYLIFVFCLSAVAADSWRGKAQKLLPAPLNAFETHKTMLSEVEKKLGKANLVEGNDYYWEKEGLKYALKLTFDNKFRLDTIHYTFAARRPELAQLGQVDTKKLEPYVSGGKTTKYFVIKENNSEVVVDPLDKSIYSVKIP